MGKDHVEWFLGAVGFPSLEDADRVVVPVPKNGVNSRHIKLHALRHQRGRSRCDEFVGRESLVDFADVERNRVQGLGFQERIVLQLLPFGHFLCTRLDLEISKQPTSVLL